MTAIQNQIAFDFNYNQMLQDLLKDYNNIDTEDLKSLKSDLQVLENFSFHKNNYFLLFDLKQFVPIYISKNISNQSYTPKSFCQIELVDGLKMLCPQHINLGRNYLKWQEKFYALLQTAASNNDQFIISGIKFKNKQNILKTFVIKGRLLTQDKGSNPRLCFLEVIEITNLWKGDIYWIQYSAERNNQLQQKIYFSSGKKKEAHHLLSPQELKIIELIAQNKPSAYIAKELGVAVETIKKHRKNMIAKTQTQDMTSLIQLLNICDMI